MQILDSGSFGFYLSILRPSSIQDQLNKPETKLEELLDNEKFSFQLKNGNPRLMDYFTKNTQNLVQLIDYIIKPPPDPNDPKRSYKYPFMACEIFEKDIASIINGVLVGRMPESIESLETAESFRSSPTKFGDNLMQSPKSQGKIDYKNFQTTRGSWNPGQKSPDKEKSSPLQKPRTILEHFFTYLDTDEEPYSILSGYFGKVVEVLFRRNPAKMIEFVYEKEGILLKMLKHISDKSISEVLTLFMTYETFHYEEEKPNFLEPKLKVMEQLVEDLVTKEDMDTSTNVANCLCEIISKHESIVDGKELVNKIVVEPVLDRIFRTLLKRDSTIVANVSTVLLFLVEFCNPARPVRNLSHSYKILKQQNRNFENHPLIQSIIKNVEVFATVLRDDYSENTRTLGMGKLRLIELTEKILKLNNKNIFKRVEETHLIEIITNSFTKFVNNNILHTTYEKLVITLLARNDPTLLKIFFDDVDILNIIMDAYYEDKIDLQQREKKVRKGNIGHMINIANHIVQYGETIPEIKEYLTINPRWDEFTSIHLKQVNQVNNTKIAGVDVKEMFPNKRESGFKRGITDELESEGFVSFKDQINMKDTNNNFGLLPASQNRPKVDEIDTPSPSLKPTQYAENRTSFSSPKAGSKQQIEETNANKKKTIYYNFADYPSQSKVEPTGEIQKFEDNIVIKSPKASTGLHGNGLSINGDLTAGENLLKMKLSPLPVRHVKSTEENKSYESAYTFDRASLDVPGQNPLKQERRKLTLVSRKSNPNAPASNDSNNESFQSIQSVQSTPQNESIDTNDLIQSSRYSYGSKLGKKVKIKIKRADTQDGTKVLEAIYKSKGLEEPESQTLQTSHYPYGQSSFHLSSPLNEPYSLSIGADNTTYTDDQLSMNGSLNKNARSKSKT